MKEFSKVLAARIALFPARITFQGEMAAAIEAERKMVSMKVCAANYVRAGGCAKFG